MDYSSIHFGTFTIDIEGLIVRQEGQEVRTTDGKSIKPRAVRILIVLIENRGKIVRADDLKDVLSQQHQDNDRRTALTKYIHHLRSCLGPSFEDYVQTISKNRDRQDKGGYKFIGNVEFTNEHGFARQRKHPGSPRSSIGKEVISSDADRVPAQSSSALPQTKTEDAWAAERTYLRYRNEPCPLLESPELVRHLEKRYRCRAFVFGKIPLPLTVIWKNVTKCISPDHILGHLDDTEPIRDTTAPTYVTAEYGRARKFIKHEYESGKIKYEGCEYCMTRISVAPGKPKIEGAFGYYYDSIITQYAIEWELKKALLAGTPIDRLSAPGTLPFREAVEAQGNPVLSGHGRRAALSISALLVFQLSDGSFSCLIRRRSLEVGVSPGMLHVVPAGMFEAANTGDRWSIELSVWRELLEEVYNDEDLLGSDRAEMPYHVRGREPVRLLCHLIETGKAEFSVTGIVCDLLNVAPEICTVLFVPDPEFVEARKMHINWEYISEDRSGSFHVPWKKIDAVIEKEAPKYGIVPGAATCIALGREWVKRRHHM